MDKFIRAIDHSSASKNWYGALFIALSLPDICGKIDQPQINSSRLRYADWFDRYLGAEYTDFLSGNDCYALRCAYLHEGSDDITTQRARETVKKFYFVAPLPDDHIVHMNMFNTSLQLQVDIFCEDMKKGVLAWMKDIESDEQKKEAIKDFLMIHLPNSSGGIKLDVAEEFSLEVMPKTNFIKRLWRFCRRLSQN